uniref:Si:zfos-1056e6.1 n=1 Tax=Acanthochromis polyacanthus TaxID=80966 RepID=A0A3Q1EJX5_9TELE
IRNHRGCLIPLNSSIPANSKHPYVLEVAKIFQHQPRPRTIPMIVINKSMKTRLQTIDRRLQIQRLNDLLPQIKLRHNEKLTQEIECLSQKLKFLHKRMQADSHSWKGVLTRAPLW